jgi:hypothetical protein
MLYISVLLGLLGAASGFVPNPHIAYRLGILRCDGDEAPSDCGDEYDDLGNFDGGMPRIANVNGDLSALQSEIGSLALSSRRGQSENGRKACLDAIETLEREFKEGDSIVEIGSLV